MVSHFSRVWLCATLWPIALQAPLSMGFSRDWTHISCVSCIGRQVLYHSATWKALFPPHCFWNFYQLLLALVGQPNFLLPTFYLSFAFSERFSQSYFLIFLLKFKNFGYLISKSPFLLLSFFSSDDIHGWCIFSKIVSPHTHYIFPLYTLLSG